MCSSDLKDYSDIKDVFRPGHADYTYHQKYGIRDYRGGGRSSARETAMRVAAGAIAKKYLKEHCGIEIFGFLEQLGPVKAERFDKSIIETTPNEWKYLGDKPAIVDFYASWIVTKHLSKR